jgi:aldehyde:ferredoxin oxidoreductase
MNSYFKNYQWTIFSVKSASVAFGNTPSLTSLVVPHGTFSLFVQLLGTCPFKHFQIMSHSLETAVKRVSPVQCSESRRQQLADSVTDLEKLYTCSWKKTNKKYCSTAVQLPQTVTRCVSFRSSITSYIVNLKQLKAGTLTFHAWCMALWGTWNLWIRHKTQK